MTWCRISAGVFMPLVKIDFVSAVNLLMEGKVIAVLPYKNAEDDKMERERARIRNKNRSNKHPRTCV